MQFLEGLQLAADLSLEQVGVESDPQLLTKRYLLWLILFLLERQFLWISNFIRLCLLNYLFVIFVEHLIV